MRDIYQMSQNACSVELNGGIKIFVRLVLWKDGKSPAWSFNVVSEDGNYCFQSCKFITSTVAINGILDFMNVVHGSCFIGRYMSPSEGLAELFSDVIFK